MIPPIEARFWTAKGVFWPLISQRFFWALCVSEARILTLLQVLVERLSLTERELEAFRERSARRRPFEAVPLKLGLMTPRWRQWQSTCTGCRGRS